MSRTEALRAELAGNLRLLDHPLIQHKLSLLRDRDTPPGQFRQLLREITLLMGYEITKDLGLGERTVETPRASVRAHKVTEEVTIVSILRAGLGMSESLRELLPFAKEGHIGVFRDPDTKKPKEYFVRLPDEPGRVLLVDPMMATGGSAVHAVDVLKRHGVAADDIRILALVVAPEGLTAFAEAHPGVKVFAAALDSHLDENAFIVPGLGDAGDRIFGTDNEE